MLKRINRLKSGTGFKRTLAGQRLCSNDCFALYGLSAGSASGGTPIEPRIGFIVSKKVHKSSVRRNRIKRRLRELLRSALQSEQKQMFSNYKTLVFIARSGSLDASFQDLQNRLENCIRHWEHHVKNP